MTFLTPAQYARKHGVSTRRIQALCEQERIQGAVKVGSRWVIPKDAPLVVGRPGRPRALIEIRVAWKIGTGSGGGMWHSAQMREAFLLEVRRLNGEYGPGTHWIEERAA